MANKYPDRFPENLEENSEFPLFSADQLKYVYSFLNALRRIEVVGGQVIYSDANIKLIVSGSGTGTTNTTSSINNTYVSSSIYCLSVWT